MGTVYSMTGFGAQAVHYGDKVVHIEIKSLNGKQSDVRCRLPQLFRDKELDIRKLVLEKAIRGKFELSMSLLTDGIEDEKVINSKLASKYISTLKTLAEENSISSEHIMQSLLQIPNVIEEGQGSITEEEWNTVKAAIVNTCDILMAFRKREGDSLKNDILARNRDIVQLLDQVSGIEGARISRLKERIKKNITEQSEFEKIDQNRLEQEYLYYIEKLDISEEKSRLTEHCAFFDSFANSEKAEKGRKLSFIAQEMGREINTMGSKAQYAELQHLVVEMKDHLEKIKEQCLNIL